jgi:hypothetical protein
LEAEWKQMLRCPPRWFGVEIFASTYDPAVVQVASFVIACLALSVALGGLTWQVYTWRQAHRFDVSVSIQQDPAPVAQKRYEITVVLRNLGSSDEAVENVALLYSLHDAGVSEDGVGLGFPSLLDHKSDSLPPRRNVRRTYDLLGSRFIECCGSVIRRGSQATRAGR